MVAHLAAGASSETCQVSHRFALDPLADGFGGAADGRERRIATAVAPSWPQFYFARDCCRVCLRAEQTVRRRRLNLVSRLYDYTTP